MKLLFILSLGISWLSISGQDTISFDWFHEQYDTGDHLFLRHLYKNLKHPEHYGQNGNIAVLEIKYLQESWEVRLIQSQFPNLDLYIVDIVQKGLRFLRQPNHTIVTTIRMKFEYVWRDERKNSKDLSGYDMVLSRSEPISCGIIR